MAACLSLLAGALLASALWSGRTVHAGEEIQSVESTDYASPLELLVSPDGARLYVLCQGSNDVRVLDAASYAVVKKIAVGRVPRGFSLSPDGARLFVTNSMDDTLSVIDTNALEVTATLPVGAEPSSVVEDREGKRLFVANRISSDVAVLDAATGIEEKRLLGGRGTSYLKLSPDGSKIYATHVYPNPSTYRTAPESEITVIDVRRAVVVDRIPLHAIAGVFHAEFSADGRLGAVAEYHPKNLVTLAHLEHGGAFEDTITVFGADVGKTVEIPLDELERYASQPFGVAIAPDKSRIYVTCGGSEIVAVIDVPRMLSYIHSHPLPFTQDLSASANYVVARIAVGLNPRGLTLTKDGSRLFVANRLDDTISVIDTRSNRVASTIKLDGPKEISVLRRGEQTFYTARYSFQGQIGCSSCHIDSTFDGLAWNLEPDGFGRSIVDNKMLEGVRDTAPYKWTGTNPNIPTECGPRTEKYFWRSENYDNLTLADLAVYVRSLEPRPNRWRLARNEMTPAQERGKAIFERSEDKFKNPIPEYNRCSFCHSGPNGTNRKIVEVGTRKPTDNTGMLKAPPLDNIALTAPYLHDGSARSLEEIWTVYNPEDKHGRTNDLTKDELNDLIEYLRTR
ncbi:MAG: beta-propeller fold lactonase family protein [Terracidiphilus sp.]